MKSNSEKFKLDQIIICALFECKWNIVSSSVIRIVFVIANCVLRGMLETGQRGAERYVTRIAS
jgi:hypothetical protein